MVFMFLKNCGKQSLSTIINSYTKKACGQLWITLRKARKSQWFIEKAIVDKFVDNWGKPVGNGGKPVK